MTVERVPRLPVLMIVTFRPDFHPPWTGQPHVMALTLNRLGRDEGATLVERVAGQKALPAEVLAQIVEQTDGVPLFVEELTKAVLESDVLRERDGHLVFDRPLPTLTIPTSLQGWLMARLDRLSPRDSHPTSAPRLAGAIPRAGRRRSGLPEEELQQALDRLLAYELIFRRGTPPRAEYIFEHARTGYRLFDDVPRQAQELRRASLWSWTQRNMPNRRCSTIISPSTHSRQGSGFLDRRQYHAARRYANAEAITHLTRGLETLADYPIRLSARRDSAAIGSGSTIMTSQGGMPRQRSRLIAVPRNSPSNRIMIGRASIPSGDHGWSRLVMRHGTPPRAGR